MDTRVKAIGKNVNGTKRAVAKAVIRECIVSTPVDKGVARSNWQALLGDYSADKVPAFAPGNHLGLAETANADAAIQAANSAIDRAAPGEDIVVLNNVDYIETLNNGSSTQMAANFVQKGIGAGIAAVNSMKVVP
jgi:hypothetical protein